MEDLVDVIRLKVIPKIDNTVKVLKVISEDATTIKVKICSLKWLKIGSSLIIGLNAFEVSEIDYQTKEIVLSKLTPTSTTVRWGLLELSKPTFVHGTRTTANNEWKMFCQHNSTVALPLIWLYESITDIGFDPDSSIYSESQTRIFFLDFVKNDGSSLVNENGNPDPNFQIRKQGVRPMIGLSDEFMRVLNEGYDLEVNKSFKRTTFSNFGNENIDGVFEAILDESLGGVEITPTLVKYKGVNCCN